MNDRHPLEERIVVNDDCFVLLEVLGRGGMGTVYKAFQESLGRVVALKSFHENDANSLLRIKREAQAAISIQHPNVVSVHSMFIAHDKPLLVMEYVHGEGLDQILAREKMLPFQNARPIFDRLLEALHAIHSAGFIHRDIKPSNIMVCVDGTVKLMDFGIAKRTTQDNEVKLTRTGLLLGSPAYMSPEQCSGGTLDQRSDLYSLGCTLYRTLLGNDPFDGETSFEVMFKHLNDQISTINGIGDNVARSVLLKSLAKNPVERFQTAKEFQDALNATSPVTLRRGKRANIVDRGRLVPLLVILVAALVGSMVYLNNFAKPDADKISTPERPTVAQTNRGSEGISILEAMPQSQLELKGIRIDQDRRKNLALASSLENQKHFDEAAQFKTNAARLTALLNRDEGWREMQTAIDWSDRTDRLADLDGRGFGARMEVYLSALDLARLQKRRENYLALSEKALSLANQKLPTMTIAREKRGLLLVNLGRFYSAEGNHREAKTCFREALKELRASQNDNSPERVCLWSELIDEMMFNNQTDEAKKLIQIQIYKTDITQDDPRKAEEFSFARWKLYWRLSDIEALAGDFNQSDRDFSTSLEAASKAKIPDLLRVTCIKQHIQLFQKTLQPERAEKWKQILSTDTAHSET